MNLKMMEYKRSDCPLHRERKSAYCTLHLYKLIYRHKTQISSCMGWGDGKEKKILQGDTKKLWGKINEKKSFGALWICS